MSSRNAGSHTLIVDFGPEFLATTFCPAYSGAMRRFIACCLIAASVCVSSLPLLPNAMFAQAMAASCLHCHMKMAAMDHASHAMTPAMQHCRIECCGHHDIDGLPYLLAPHAISAASLESALVMPNVVVVEDPMLETWLLPFPTPPPRTA